jgi:hypothetical protein
LGFPQQAFAPPSYGSNLIIAPCDLSNPAYIYQSDTYYLLNTGLDVNSNMVMDRVMAGTTVARHYVYQRAAMTAGTVYYYSLDARADFNGWLHLAGDNNFSPYYANFDLFNGVLGSTNAPIETRTITNLGNGLFRCTGLTQAVATGNNRLFVSPSPAERAVRYPHWAGDGLTGIQLCNIQVREVL